MYEHPESRDEALLATRCSRRDRAVDAVVEVEKTESGRQLMAREEGEVQLNLVSSKGFLQLV